MTAAYQCQQENASLFSEADAYYSTIKNKLTSADYQELTDPEAQRSLAIEENELMRLLFQAFITLRGQAQAQEPVIGSDGTTRTHVKTGKSRDLETVFGTVKVERTDHLGREHSALYPVDANLNLPTTKYSVEVERQVSLAAAHMSFDETVELVSRTTGAHVPKRQAEEVTQRAASDFTSFYELTALELGEPTGNLLILTFEQKGIILKPEDLLPATRKAADDSKPQMDTRTSKGEPKRGRKRMAAVAAVYTVLPFMRTPQEIIAGLRHIRDAIPQNRPRPEDKRVWATLTSDMKEVIAEAFDEANDRDPDRRKRWLVLVDGDKKLAPWVRAEAQKRGVKIILILDFIHALEYLWKAGHLFFKVKRFFQNHA